MLFEHSCNFFFLAESSSPLDGKQAVQFIQNELIPVINWATNWGLSAGFGMLGIVLFYEVVIIIVRPPR